MTRRAKIQPIYDIQIVCSLLYEILHRLTVSSRGLLRVRLSPRGLPRAPRRRGRRRGCRCFRLSRPGSMESMGSAGAVGFSYAFAAEVEEMLSIRNRIAELEKYVRQAEASAA